MRVRVDQPPWWNVLFTTPTSHGTLQLQVERSYITNNIVSYRVRARIDKPNHIALSNARYVAQAARKPTHTCMYCVYIYMLLHMVLQVFLYFLQSSITGGALKENKIPDRKAGP